MRKMNFITRHLIGRIGTLIEENQKSLNHSSFLYLDKPTKTRTKFINRVNKLNYYYQNEILPQSFYFLEPTQLMDIYDSLKTNNFFIYKTIKGKDYKTRIKKRD
jgi:hypothetical protein